MTDMQVMYGELCDSRRGHYGVDWKTIEGVLRRRTKLARRSVSAAQVELRGAPQRQPGT